MSRDRPHRRDRGGRPPAPSAAARPPAAGGRTGSTSPPGRARRPTRGPTARRGRRAAARTPGCSRASSVDVAERVVEPEDRPVVDRQQVVELGREVDRHAEPDHADDHGADEDGDLGGLAGHAVDEVADPAAPLDALERAPRRRLRRHTLSPVPAEAPVQTDLADRRHDEGDHRTDDHGGHDQRPRQRARRRRRTAPTPRRRGRRRASRRSRCPRAGCQELARRRADLDLTEAAHVERVQRTGVLVRAR